MAVISSSSCRTCIRNSENEWSLTLELLVFGTVKSSMIHVTPAFLEFWSKSLGVSKLPVSMALLCHYCYLLIRLLCSWTKNFRCITATCRAGVCASALTSELEFREQRKVQLNALFFLLFFILFLLFIVILCVIN